MAVVGDFQCFEHLEKIMCRECDLQEGSWTFIWKREE